MDRQKAALIMQEAALIIVGVPLRQLLVAVHNIDRVVDVQDNRPGWLLVTPAPDIDQGVIFSWENLSDVADLSRCAGDPFGRRSFQYLPRATEII
jgi:hypothetical protein